MNTNHTNPSPIGTVEIDKWRWTIGSITDGLLVGGDLPQYEPEAIQMLDSWVEAGVTHILDVRGEYSDERLVARHAEQIGYSYLGTHDDGTAQSDDWFDVGVQVGREALAQEGAGLLVHCHMGINRGPSMAFAILLDRGWDPIEALDAIRAARPIAAVLYADDAIKWHLRRAGASADQIELQRKRIALWQRRNEIDTSTVIRRIRVIEGRRAA